MVQKEELHELEVDPYPPRPLNGHQLPLPSVGGTCHLGKHLVKTSWNLHIKIQKEIKIC